MNHSYTPGSLFLTPRAPNGKRLSARARHHMRGSEDKKPPTAPSPPKWTPADKDIVRNPAYVPPAVPGAGVLLPPPTDEERINKIIERHSPEDFFPDKKPEGGIPLPGGIRLHIEPEVEPTKPGEKTKIVPKFNFKKEF
ncbi:hypothetical protein [Prosthecobacter sp.]|uniref:hypothetical protein n=1 Tax=Prosthecobacter sp. TaxID=1965333 RepID=UPI003783DDF4